MRILVVLVFAIIFAPMVIACNANPRSPTQSSLESANSSSSHPDIASNYPVTVTDGFGKPFTFNRAPQRIIAIDSATVEILFAIGYGHKIVGTHEFVDYPLEAEVIPRIGNAFALDLESIVSLNPDLVVIFFENPYRELTALDLPVLYLDSPTELDEIPTRFRMWGVIVDRIRAAVEVSDQFQTAVASSTKSMDPRPGSGPTVFYDLAPGWWTAGKGTLANDLLMKLGADNIFGDVSGWGQVSMEQIVERNPSAIITLHPGGRTKLLSIDVLAKIEAVSNDRIFEMDPDLLSIEGPRLILGLNLLASWLSQFGDNGN